MYIVILCMKLSNEDSIIELSIIVPVYSIPELYLRQAIESCISNDALEIEIILVDDGSPDNCGKICDEYALIDKRIRVIHKENGGVSEARNDGINAARGKWIAFLDPDDYFNESSIEKVLKTLRRSSADIIVWGYKEIINDECLKIYHTDNRIISGTNDIHQFARYIVNIPGRNGDFGFTLGGAWGACWGKLFRHSLFSDSKNRFEEKMHPQEDLLLLFKLAVNAKSIEFIDDSIVCYRINPFGVLHKASSNAIDNDLIFLNKLAEYININLKWTDISNIINGASVAMLGDIIKRYYSNPGNNEKMQQRINKMKRLVNNEHIDNACKERYKKGVRFKHKLLLTLVYRKNWYLLYLVGRIIYAVRK